MSASDCELCGSPIVTRRMFPVFAVTSVHGVQGSVAFDFFGVLFLDDLDGGVMDFLSRELSISGSSKKGGRFVADNDFRSEDCNGERRTPAKSSFGMVDKVVGRNGGIKSSCSSSVLTLSSSNDG